VGRYAKSALETAGLWELLKPKLIYTQNVRQALDYIVRSEVDVGFVYSTDIAAMSDKVSTLIEIRTNIPITYPIAIVSGAHAEALAQEFIDYISTESGQQILRKYGFSKP
jgi:molybdate transport system substrate-binding protein